jgi:polyhydroxyalkanoate synthesis regulator phasin
MSKNISAKGAVKFNLTIPTMLLDRFKEIAETTNTSMSVILNQLISDYVNHVDRIQIHDLEDRVEELEKSMAALKEEEETIKEVFRRR